MASYVRLHAKDPIVGPVTGAAGAAGAGAVSNALTLESWALAISGAVNIEEYCQQHISSMQKDQKHSVELLSCSGHSNVVLERPRALKLVG